MKRLSEGFLLRERSRAQFLLSESDPYNDLHELVRNSPYYARLPPLAIECVELDGVPDTLPILIEEIYSAIEPRSTSAGTGLRSKPSNGNTENPIVQAVQSFSKNLLKGI